MEGSCNAMCEALALGIPIIASHISGLVGTLGEDYPGYFPAQDTAALAGLLARVERDRPFYDSLSSRCREAAKLLEPGREQQAWRTLLAELA